MGLVDKKLGKFYSKIFGERQEGDYKDLIEFECDIVRGWLEGTGEFLEEIERITLTMVNR